MSFFVFLYVLDFFANLAIINFLVKGNNSKNPKYYPKPPNTVAKKINIGKKGTIAENKVFAVYKIN